MKTFYFTATGNSLYVAKRIGGDLYSVAQLLKGGSQRFEDEKIGFVFPCHGFGIPRMVDSFIKNNEFSAGYFFAVMTYGNIACAGLDHIERAAAKAGIKFNYTNEILMVDNYLPLFKMENEILKESNSKIDDIVSQIADDIKNKANKRVVKDLIKKTISRVIYRLFIQTKFDSGDKDFIIDDSSCDNCGVCAKVCPTGNISYKKSITFNHRCDRCFSCIHHCPKGAIHLNDEKSAARFINPNVKLPEIIAANRQDEFD